MKLNSDIKIIGKQVILVPYRKHHVPKYHTWMKSTELQMLTASEPLSLEQEFSMQKSWMEDEDKCTFIILDKAKIDQNEDEIEAMVGDTNIFITDKEKTANGEIEIMIAEKSARGKKFGWEATILMFLFGIKEVGVLKFQAKISFHNVNSIKMFEKLHFEEQSRSAVFEEVTLLKVVCEDWTKWLEEQYQYEIQAH